MRKSTTASEPSSLLETALYHALGKLPEPDVAHKFFDQLKITLG